jgi:hypothetical protein
MEPMPPEIGTAPIPHGHIRLFHYTRGNPEIIRKEGLKLSKARGHTYGEPNMIWGSTIPPSLDHNIVEYHVDAYDPGISHVADYPGKGTDLEKFQKELRHVCMVRDIKSDEFIGIHEPWHNYYYYIKEHPNVLKDILSGRYDNLVMPGDTTDPRPAIARIKAEMK